MQISEIEKAYIAGFFDGEGSVLIRCNSRKTNYGTTTICELAINLSNNDYEVLKFVRDKLGGRITRRYDRQHPHSLRLESLKAVAFLEAIYPYLITKKKQAEIGIKFQSLIMPKGQKVTNMNERLELVRMIKQNRDDINNKIAQGDN